MSNSTKLKLLALFLVVIAAVAFVYASFAYFRAAGAINLNMRADVVQSNEVPVSDFYGLYRYTKASAYNAPEPVSQVTDRRTIVLQNSIVLEDDLYVTADAHINLNGCTLSLDGHSLIFQHGYYGSVVIENGTIDAGSGGQVVMDTPHAAYMLSSVDCSAPVRVLAMDADMTAYNAFYFVANALVNDVDPRMERLNYAEIAANGFTLSDLIATRRDCPFCGADSSCVFVDRNVDLPFYYFSEDVAISYASSNPSLLSSIGSLGTLPQAYETVNLTVSAAGHSMTVPIHVVNTADSAAAAQLGEALIRTRLQDHWTESDTKVLYAGTEMFDKYYLFTSGIDLPIKSPDFDLRFSYQVKDYQHNVIETSSKVVGDVYRFEPNERCFYLETTVTDGKGNTSSFEVPIYCTYVTNAETVIRLLMNDVYGGSIIYDSSQRSKHLYSLAEICGEEPSDLTITAALKEYVTAYGITDISYSLIADAARDYRLHENDLSAAVNSVKYKETGVEVTATFSDGSQQSIELYVLYLTGSSDTAAGYWSYYSYYNENYVPATLATKFTMPFAYNLDRNYGAPYTVYDVAYNYNYSTKKLDGVDTTIYYSGGSEDNPLQFGMPPGLTVRLVEGNTTYVTLDYSSHTSLTDAFNDYLRTSGKTLNDLKRAQWEFSINAPGLTFYDIGLILLYNYTFDDSQPIPNWQKYTAPVGEKDYYTNLTVSKLTMEGGLIWAAGNTANHVPDADLFTWMYNSFNPGRVELLDGADLSAYYIQNDWLSANVALDAQNDSLSNVANWYGIQYMDATTAVNLSGVPMTQEILGYVTGPGINSMGMNAVENLYLENCGLTNAVIGNSLSAMKRLKVLDLTKNSITLFEDVLSGIPALHTVYLFDNKAAGGHLGCEGICNFQTYEDLSRKGVSVYYTLSNSGIPILFENARELNDYQRLKDLEYQSMLSRAEDITSLYSSFAQLTAAQLHLSGNITQWGYEPGKSVNDATYFYVTVAYDDAPMTVKYYVDRY